MGYLSQTPKEKGWTPVVNLVVTPKIMQVHCDLANFNVLTREVEAPFEVTPFLESMIRAEQIRPFLTRFASMIHNKSIVDIRFKNIKEGRFLRNIRFLRYDSDYFIACTSDYAPFSIDDVCTSQLLPPHKAAD